MIQEFTQKEIVRQLQDILSKQGFNLSQRFIKAEYYINCRGWDITYSKEPTEATPTGKHPDYPRRVYITSKNQIFKIYESETLQKMINCSRNCIVTDNYWD